MAVIPSQPPSSDKRELKVFSFPLFLVINLSSFLLSLMVLVEATAKPLCAQ